MLTGHLSGPDCIVYMMHLSDPDSSVYVIGQ